MFSYKVVANITAKWELPNMHLHYIWSHVRVDGLYFNIVLYKNTTIHVYIIKSE